MSIYFFLCLLFLVIIQGGYYPQTYIIVGIVSVVLLIIRNKRICITLEHMALMLLAIIYVISAVVNGMAYSLISKAMLPLTLFVVAILYTTLDKGHKDKLLDYITVAGVISSLAGILMYYTMSDSDAVVSGKSLMFTFQYANAAGCWYAVCFVMALFSDNRYIKYSSALCLVALLYTRSYGAIVILGIMLAIHGIRSEWVKRRFANRQYMRVIMGIALAVVSCAGVYILCRIGTGSLLERVIHSYDGLHILVSNIAFGIGPDSWHYVFPYYQTAYYPAGVIHNSYVQAGVDAGILSMLILLLILAVVIYRYKKNKSVYNLAALIIMVHSVMEYNLYFSSLDVLLIILAMKENVNENRISVYMKKPIVIIAGALMLCIFSFSIYGISRVNLLESYFKTGNMGMVEKVFEENILFMENGYRESEIYGICSVMYGLDYIPDKKSARYKRYEMIYKEDISINDIIGYIEEQKYYKNVRIEGSKLVKHLNVPEEQKRVYYEYVNNIDDSINGWLRRKKHNSGE